MTIHASMDIETLDTRASSVVLSMGVCFFDDEKMQTFDEIVADGINYYFEQVEQINEGRTISPATLNWWVRQGPAAQECLDNPNKIHIRDFYILFDEFCKEKGICGDGCYDKARKNMKWYIRGPHFDISIMDELFKDFNITSPWRYWNVRDIRTWLDCNGFADNIKLKKPESMVAHNSLHDAAFDAWMMQQVLHNPDNLEFEERE